MGIEVDAWLQFVRIRKCAVLLHISHPTPRHYQPELTYHFIDVAAPKLYSFSFGQSFSPTYSRRIYLRSSRQITEHLPEFMVVRCEERSTLDTREDVVEGGVGDGHASL